MDCAAERHLEPEPAEPHAHLCRPCRTRLSRHLRRLPGLYDELDLTPGSYGTLGRRSDDRCSPKCGPECGHAGRLPYSDQISECRSQIRHDLLWWTCRIADIRRCGYPQFTIPAMAGWLHAQIPFAIYRDWAADLAGAITHDHGRALALLDPWPAATIERKEFTCPCGGQLVFTMYGDQDKRPSFAACQACEGRWDIGPAWMTLRKQMRTAA